MDNRGQKQIKIQEGLRKIIKTVSSVSNPIPDPLKDLKAVIVPPRISWEEGPTGWVPTIYLANISMPLEPRPLQGFMKGERDAILVWIKQALSDSLFGTPVYLVNHESGAMAKNPDWDMLPFIVRHADGKWVEVEQEPSDEQLEASAGLTSPIITK
tara:strand:- start:999 stop:1466 length:468 start_codon:yes stop_codon:yes gene_type:complete